MSEATATVETVSVDENLSAGELACIQAAAPGATVGVLLKAVWSTRGFLRVPYGAAGAFGGLGIVKADLTGLLKNLPAGDPAPYILKPVQGGAELHSVE